MHAHAHRTLFPSGHGEFVHKPPQLFIYIVLELKGIKFSQVIFCISDLFLFLLSSRTIKKWPCSCEINLYIVAVPAVILEPGHSFPDTVVGRQRLSYVMRAWFQLENNLAAELLKDGCAHCQVLQSLSFQWWTWLGVWPRGVARTVSLPPVSGVLFFFSYLTLRCEFLLLRVHVSYFSLLT